jgi:hypothetical protein
MPPSKDVPAPQCAADAGAAYDPYSRQPRTLGELERWLLADAASNRATLLPFPVPLNPPPIPGLDRLSAYCNAKFGENFSVEAVRRLIGEYALNRDVSRDEARAASLQDAADTLAPQSPPAAGPHQGGGRGNGAGALDPAVKGKQAGRKGVRDKKMEARDKWIYQQCCKGNEMPLDKIVAELKRCASKRRWRVINSIQGIRIAAARYAKRHGLKAPPSRQNL